MTSGGLESAEVLEILRNKRITGLMKLLVDSRGMRGA